MNFSSRGKRLLLAATLVTAIGLSAASAAVGASVSAGDRHLSLQGVRVLEAQYVFDTLNRPEYLRLMDVLATPGSHKAYWASIRKSAARIYAPSALDRNVRDLETGLRQLKGNTYFGKFNLVSTAKFVSESPSKVRVVGNLVYLTVRGHFVTNGSRNRTEPSGVYHALFHKVNHHLKLANLRVRDYHGG